MTRNRAVLAGLVGLRAEDLAIMHVSHGTDFAAVTGPGVVEGVDILVTDRADVGLVATGADCVTMALVDVDSGVLAAVHCGWRGVAVDTPGAAVDAFVTAGGEPERARAILGAAICPACNEVSEQVRDQVGESASDAVAESSVGTPSVDLHAGVVQQLRRRGITRIERDRACTFEDEGLFSYRRQNVTGRQGVVVRIVPEEFARGSA